MSQTQALAPPFVLQLKPENIPEELKNISQWVGWVVGKHKPDGRYDKIPVDMRAKPCNAHISQNQMSFEDAKFRYENNFFAGIGFVLNGNLTKTKSGEMLYLVGIDIDHCVHINKDGDKEMSGEVTKIWISLGRPYLEFSPSGTGVRMFVYSRVKIESSNANGHEMYVNGRYLTLTGHGSGEIIEATDALLVLHQEWFPKKYLKTKLNLVASAPYKSTESASEIENRLRSALAAISSDDSYDNWRDITWSIKASGLDNAEDIAREWSKLAPERYDDEGFDRVWHSFDPERGITLGTVYHHAQLAGWQNSTSPPQIVDEGDILNGRIFADTYRGTILFIYETASVLLFDPIAGWVYAPPFEAERLAKVIVKQLQADAAESFKRDPTGTEAKRKLAHASRSSMEPRIKATISMAQSEPSMTVRLSEFDSALYLLGVQNGILDLRACQLLTPSPQLLVSMRANIAFMQGVRCPQWMSFLNTVQPNKAVQRLLQQLVGIFLTGESGQQKLIIFYGLGANGKSTFIEVIAWLLGDYGLRIATEMLMHHQRSPQGPSPDIVSLKGRRMAYCNEVEEGRRIDEARVKEHTGGDTLTGRTPYAKHSVTFRPTHNLVMVGNHKPEIRDMSHGMWRRILLVVFGVTIPPAMQDPLLVEKLKSEGSGILNWALAGYRDYQRNGLLIPKVITAAADEYKDEEDILGEWLAEHSEAAVGAKSAIDECYKAYRYWSNQRGHHPLAQSRLTKRLKDRGFDRDGGKRHYLGFELNPAAQAGALNIY